MSIALLSLFNTAAAYEPVSITDATTFYRSSGVENCDEPYGDADRDGDKALVDSDCRCSVTGGKLQCTAKTIEQVCTGTVYECNPDVTKGPAITGTAEGERDIIPIRDFMFEADAVDGLVLGAGGALPPGLVIADPDPEVVMAAIEEGVGEVRFAVQFNEGFGRDGLQFQFTEEGEFGGWLAFNDPRTGFTGTAREGALTVLD